MHLSKTVILVALVVVATGCGDDSGSDPSPFPPGPEPAAFRLEVGTAEIGSRGTIDVTCRISGVDPGVSGVAFRVKFDRDVLSLHERASFVPGPEHPDALTLLRVEEGTIHLAITAIDGGTLDGELGWFRMAASGPGFSAIAVDRAEFLVVDADGGEHTWEEFEIVDAAVIVR